ncbi:hypothetical protein GCM10027266_07050 [Arenimonas alkanexedens]
MHRAIGQIYVAAPDPGRAIVHWQAAARAGLQTGDPRLWANALSQLSNLGYRTGDFALAMDAERRARDAARRFGLRREEIRSTLDMGTLAVFANNYDEAEGYLRTALAGYRDIGDLPGEARALRGLGRLMDNRGRYASAITLQVDGLAKMQGVGSPMDLSESYFSIGRLFMNLEDYEAAETSLDKALELLPDTPNFFPRGLNLNNRAMVHRMRGQPEQGLADIDAALAIMVANGSVPGQAMGRTERGKLLTLLERNEEGLEEGIAALALARQVGEAAMVGDALLAVSSTYNEMGRHAESKVLAEEVVAIGEATNNDRYRSDGALEMEKALAGLGQPAEALRFSRLAREAQQRIAGPGRLGRLAQDSAPAELAQARERLLTLARAPTPTAARPPTDTVVPVSGEPGVSPSLMAGLAVLALLLAWGLVRTVRRLRHTHQEKERISERQRELESAHTDLQSKSERLRQQVTLDPLTGCLTRGAFAGELSALLVHANHHGRSVALLVFDLDNFKAINDQHGHLAGDDALRLVTGIARAKLRSDDLLGRFGGDEFLIACEGMDLPTAEALAEQIRFDVAWRAPTPAADTPGLSISVGVATSDRSCGYDPESLFHRADTALYAAKRGGRNRVQVDAPGDTTPSESRRARHWGEALAD